MSSFVVFDAVVAGFKETGKFGILYLVVWSSYAVLNSKKHFLHVFLAGFALSLLSGIAVAAVTESSALRNVVGNLIYSSFALFLLLSALALLSSSGLALFYPVGKAGEERKVIAGPVIFVLSIIFFFPESAAFGFMMRETVQMRGHMTPALLSAGAGTLLAAGAIVLLRRSGFSRMLGTFFDVPQILLLCAVLKLMASGMRGVEQITLIPSVQAGLMKFFHDVVHQNFVMFMVPDHMLLKTTVWNFVGILFGPKFSLLVSLAIVLFIPLMFLYYTLRVPPQVPQYVTGAEKRKSLFIILSDRRRKSVPVVFFVLLIVIAWYIRGGETTPRLYNPAAKPVIAEQGQVRIPIADPAMNLRDGRLHKFVLVHQGEEVRFFVIRKPDNSLSVCLDACEICPPEGYGQREHLVICIFCNTPIPVETLGRPGGCNPIPLDVATDDAFLLIGLDEIEAKRALINTGKTGESR